MTLPSLPACPNPACEQPHVIRNGSSGGRRRYHCRGCDRFFGETAGTPMYRLHTPAAEVAQALLIVMRRGSLRAAEEITGHKYETIGERLHVIQWLGIGMLLAGGTNACGEDMLYPTHWNKPTRFYVSSREKKLWHPSLLEHKELLP